MKWLGKILLFAFYCLIAGMLLLIVEIVFTLKLLYDNYLRSFDNANGFVWFGLPYMPGFMQQADEEIESKARA